MNVSSVLCRSYHSKVTHNTATTVSIMRTLGYPQIRRSYTTGQIDVDRNDLIQLQMAEDSYKLVVPLPSHGKRLFTLPRGPFRSFLQNLKIEDPTIKDVDIYDTNELRIASSVNTGELVKSDFKLKINGKFYLVSSSSRSKVYEKISQNPNYKLVNDYIMQKSNECETISIDEYIDKTTELGISESEARELLKTFSIGGQVTYFHSSPELQNTIFLHPVHLISQVEQVLKVNYLRRPLAEKIRRLQKLKGELKSMEEKKQVLEGQAQKTVKVAAWSLFGFLSLQSLLFARLVWWDFDWGIMEPVTWFTSVCEMTIGGYIYYLFVRQEYGNTSIAGMISKKRFESLCSKTSLDLVAMENLKNRITQIEADVMSETAKDKSL